MKIENVNAEIEGEKIRMKVTGKAYVKTVGSEGNRVGRIYVSVQEKGKTAVVIIADKIEMEVSEEVEE